MKQDERSINRDNKNGQAIARSAWVTVKNPDNRELVVSGISIGNTITLTTLRGQLVKQATAIIPSRITIDLSTVKSGCYLINISDERGRFHKCQIVSVY